MATLEDTRASRAARPRGAPELLRVTTAGSVDDGKSTLIGRLLHDTKSILEDQLEAVQRTSVERGDGRLDLALLTDGLRAEREQGITIDVAYRFFATSRRSFILADTPGHVRYTRNMVTGASTADLALVLIDARQGVLEQSRRHAFIASLLRVPHIVAVVNKMDLVDFDEDTFLRDRRRLPRVRAPHGRRRRRRDPGLRAAGRQRRRAVGRDGLVRRAAAAALPRGGRRRRRPPRARPRAPAGAVRRAPARRRPPRLPRLRGPRGRRDAAGRRGRRRAAQRRALAGGRHRHLRRPARRGRPRRCP